MTELYRAEEYSIGKTTSVVWNDRLLRIFPALRNHNYQLYFYGQLVSLVGTWLQIVAEGWLVLQLTQSPFLIGLVAVMATLPTLLFSLFGGVVVDRLPKKKILLFTQSSALVLAFVYGVLTVFHFITIWEIMALAFLLGCVTALDSPARQSFVVELVGKEDLPSAIAINSGIFNGARVIGPSIAGFLIAIVGSGGAFLLNSASYVAVILALISVHVTSQLPEEHPHPVTAIKQGIQYATSHPIIRTLLLFAGVVSIFGWSYSTMMPYIAQHTFHLNAAGLGYLYAATGIGALGATVLVSAYGKKVSPLVFILGGNALFAVAIFLFTFTSWLPLALVLLFFAGLGLLSQFAMMNTTIQGMVKDNFRGRIMSIYSIMFLGMAPLGNFQVGFLSEHFSTDFAIRLGAVITLAFGVFVYFRRNKIRAAQAEYHAENGQ